MELMENDVYVVSVAAVQAASCSVPQMSRVRPLLSVVELVAFPVTVVHHPLILVLPVVVLTARTLSSSVPALPAKEVGPATAVLFVVVPNNLNPLQRR